MQKTQYICDLCGATKDKYSDVFKLEIERTSDKLSTDSYDLCIECHKNLMALIKSMKKKK